MFESIQNLACHITHLTLAGPMFFNCRRKEQSWEVVDCRTVEPVPTYDDGDGESPLLS